MKHTRAGLGYGIGAYLIWGAFPFYFGLIAMVSPLEVVPWRVGTSLIFCAILATFTTRWPQITTILRNPRLLGWFALSGILLYANWQIFVIGVMTGHVLETSLGYFINPLFTILIGVIFRKERLSRLQWAAVGIAAVGVVTAGIAYGSFPWIAVGVALTFGLYGAVHKHVGEHADGLTGLTVETLVTVPVGIVQMIVVAATAGLTAYAFGPGIMLLVLGSGIMTAVPLILFGESARRLPLSYLGFLQFLTPILGFLYGYVVMHEEVSVGRWIGFIAVWVALIVLIIDMVIQLRRSPQAQLATGPIPLD
ncbi:EamA family transporter RarD [Leucobacter coleopterorum]|uniref:EamA family transporter RarD n=1 Tax=Leucobacter coleopterorum TaxID=2714933 RepID=A0ABX6JZH6_9MICO|nr:EamA family transporter RarD [Leucobacter coleopterorum]QIM18170.1 EamA family transporter RarD [Leucobacter coleopterorum]